MDRIRDLLQLAARRLECNAFLQIFHRVAWPAAIVVLLLMMADRLPAASFVPWVWVGPAIALMVIATSIIIWVRRRAPELHVAVTVDERLDLREKLSTALLCESRQDPFARAAVADAVATANEPKVREQICRRIRIAPPRLWWASPLLVFLAIMASFLAPLNLFERKVVEDSDVQQVKARVSEQLSAVVKAVDDKPQLKKELSDLVGELGSTPADTDSVRTPEEIRRDALKKVSDLNRRLDDILNGEKGKTQQAMEKSLAQITPPKDGPAKELAEALAAGDMKAAQDALKALAEKAANGQMNPKDQKKAAEQLQQLAQQLQQLAEQQKKLEDALKQAGLNPQLANNPQALQQALQQNQNLNDQQKQQLQQMAQAQQQAQQMMQNLGQAMQQMAQAMQQQQAGQQQQGQQGQQQQGQQGQNQPGQQGQNAQQMAQLAQAAQNAAGQLTEMEQLRALMDEAQAAMNTVQGQAQGLGQGLSMQQQDANGMVPGPGMNRGIGSGKRPMAPAPANTVRVKADSKTTEGDIIGKTLFDGPQIRGESKAKIVQIVTEAREGFDESLEEEAVQRKYREAQMHYFGELEKLTKALQEAAAAGAPPEAPAAEQPAPAPEPSTPAAESSKEASGGGGGGGT